MTGTAKSISSAGRRWRTRTVIGFAQGMFQYWGDTFIYGINNTQPGVVNSTVYPPFFAPDGQNYTFCESRASSEGAMSSSVCNAAR